MSGSPPITKSPSPIQETSITQLELLKVLTDTKPIATINQNLLLASQERVLDFFEGELQTLKGEESQLAFWGYG
jgi:hypothetical protein